jgi:prepilin-type N-terminal cleavage/methylation domain-containing protein
MPDAFTMVELMVVIGIVSILCALAAPAVIAGRNKVSLAACANNLKQLHLALVIYCGDNQDRLPPNHDGFITNDATAGWTVGNMMNDSERTNVTLLNGQGRTALGRYLQGPSVYKCPKDTAGALRSYSLNGWINPVRESGPPRWVGAGTNSFKIFRLLGECGSPASLVSFLHEDPLSINDGYFAVSMKPSEMRYIDIPYLGHGKRGTASGFDGRSVTFEILVKPEPERLLEDGRQIADMEKFKAMFTDKTER